MDRIEECGMDEGGMPASLPAPEMDRGNPVTLNVSMNASGKEHVEDLLDMMKNAGLGDAKPAADAMLPMRMDMERLRDMMDEPEKDGKLDLDMDGDHQPDLDTEEIEEGQYDGKSREELLKMKADAEASIKNMQSSGDGSQEKFYDETQMMMAQQYLKDIEDALEKVEEGADEADIDLSKFSKEMLDQIKNASDAELNKMAVDFGGSSMEIGREEEMFRKIRAQLNKQDEGYDNEPDPEYQDHHYMTKDLSGGLNRKKKAYAAAQDGDNAMAVEEIKAQLLKALSEKKKPDANKNSIPDYAEDGKGPNDLAKGKKGSKPKKGEVPPQFKKM